MDSKYLSAVEWISKATQPYIKNNQLDLSRIDPSEVVLRLVLGVYWLPDDEEGLASTKNGAMVCHSGAADYLLSICEKSRAAFSLLATICADYVRRGVPLSGSLSVFAQHYFLDQIERPKPVRAHQTAFQNCCLLTWAKTVSRDYSLSLTRNKASTKKISACDAVAAGLASNGHHRTADSIMEICSGTTHKKARQMSDQWVAAYQDARAAGIIPAKVLDRYWYGL